MFKIYVLVRSDGNALCVKKSTFTGQKIGIAVLKRYPAAIRGVIARRAKQGI